MTITLTLPEYIHRKRLLAGLPQVDLALSIELSQQTIAKWERGVTAPRVRHLKPLAKALKVPYPELVDVYFVHVKTRGGKQ
jgi:transcriptional regulator with XRE-family HTH domain